MDELKVKVAEVEARAKSNTKRIDDLEDRQKNLDRIVGSIDVLANEQGHIKNDVTEIKADVKELTQKPMKRYDSIVNYIMTAVLGAAIGFLLKTIGIF